MTVTADEVVIARFEPWHAAGIVVLARAEDWPTFSDPDRVVRLFTAPGVVGLCALRGTTVVGESHLLSDGHHGYLSSLLVAAEVRGCGIGRRLVAEAFTVSGAERVDVLTTPEADSFYRRFPHRSVPGFRLHPDQA